MTTEKVTNVVEVPIFADITHLTPKERKLLLALRDVTVIMDKVYCQQLAEGFYPPDLSVDEFSKFANAVDGSNIESILGSIISPFTVIRRDGDNLRAIPYSQQYADLLNRASNLLIDACSLTEVEDRIFCNFLWAKAKSFVNNAHSEADLKWMEVANSTFEFTVGPNEEYDDDYMGTKRSFEGVLAISLPEENERVKKFKLLAQEFDLILGRDFGYKPSGDNTTMVVADQIFAGGFAARKYISMAYNLPNDLWIKEKYGSKKVFLRNVMLAKFEHLTTPVAGIVAQTDDLVCCNFENYLNIMVAHEIAHGFGFSCQEGMRELQNPLEEAKADILGLMFLHYLGDAGYLPEQTGYAATVLHIIDGLWRIRLSQDEAHGLGAIIQYRWLMEFGTLKIANGKLIFNKENLLGAIYYLGSELFRLSQAKNYVRVQTFVQHWGRKVPEIDELVAQLAHLPTDIKPVFDNFDNLV